MSRLIESSIMDGFGNGARVQVASTSKDLTRFGANSTGKGFVLLCWTFFLRPCCYRSILFELIFSCFDEVMIERFEFDWWYFLCRTII